MCFYIRNAEVVSSILIRSTKEHFQEMRSVGNGGVRVYLCYSKIHGKGVAFYGLRQGLLRALTILNKPAYFPSFLVLSCFWVENRMARIIGSSCRRRYWSGSRNEGCHRTAGPLSGRILRHLPQQGEGFVGWDKSRQSDLTERCWPKIAETLNYHLLKSVG